MDYKSIHSALKKFRPIASHGRVNVPKRASGERVQLSYKGWEGEPLTREEERILRTIAKHYGADIDKWQDGMTVVYDFVPSGTFINERAERHPIRTGGPLSMTDWSRYSSGSGTRHVSAQRRNPYIRSHGSLVPGGSMRDSMISLGVGIGALAILAYMTRDRS